MTFDQAMQHYDNMDACSRAGVMIRLHALACATLVKETDALECLRLAVIAEHRNDPLP